MWHLRQEAELVTCYKTVKKLLLGVYWFERCRGRFFCPFRLHFHHLGLWRASILRAGPVQPCRSAERPLNPKPSRLLKPLLRKPLPPEQPANNLLQRRELELVFLKFWLRGSMLALKILAVINGTMQFALPAAALDRDRCCA